MSKVYCKGCKYLVTAHGYVIFLVGTAYFCDHPKNIIIETSSLEKYESYPAIKHCNKNNDCKYRKQKPWYMFWRG